MLQLIDRARFDKDMSVRFIYTKDVVVRANDFPRRLMATHELDLVKFAKLMTARGAQVAIELLDDGSGNCKICDKRFKYGKTTFPLLDKEHTTCRGDRVPETTGG